mmetsp:Transcript_14289/g.21521  ORF Transcript_14289/g.21521 Transcript_14289/m.21521 type:complete len:412 (+) Transcript_14289:221-1456(+)
MATPPQSTTTPRAHNISSLTIYAVALSILSAVTVSFVFYLCFGLLAAIVTFVLYSLALVGMYGCKPLIEVVCYPRYGSLSERRKGEVDEVRVQGINRLMEGVTMTVQQEHLMHKTMTTATTSKSDSSITSATVECSTSSTSSGSCTLEHIISSLESSEEDEDVELGHQANALTCHASVQNDEHDDDMNMTSTCDNDDVLPCHSSVQDDDEERGEIAVALQLYKKDEEDTDSSSTSSSVGTESAETEYTHVRIPCSGMMQCSSCSDIDPTTALASKYDNDVPTTATPRTREVSINCPICLSSYQPHQSICYSFSSQCPHVFHSECLMRWFLEMGRQNVDIIIGHGTKLDESSLLEYALSCPCCRQPFVQSELLQKDVGKEDKNVMDKNENRITSKVTEVEEMEEDEEHESPV